jgi:hypothetical protein
MFGLRSFRAVSSSMHVYGSRAQSGVLDRWPAPSAAIGRVTLPKAPTWDAPNIATRVDMPPPAIWAAPNPDLLLSITIAPLRFVPVTWGPPVVVQSPWGPPVLDMNDHLVDTEPAHVHRSRRTRALAFGLATAAAAVASTIVVIVAR